MQRLGASSIPGTHHSSARHEVTRHVRSIGCRGNVKRGIASVDVMPNLLEKKLRGRGPRRSGSNWFRGEAGICGEQPGDALTVTHGTVRIGTP